MRGPTHTCSINNCKSIFVTKNSDIPRAVYNLYGKRFRRGEINFAITDIDLTAVLWLSSFGNKSDLPQFLLLENAYAACRPSDSVLDAFFNKINNMEKNGELSNERAILLRSKQAITGYLFEYTSNDSTKVNTEVILDLNRRMIDDVIADLKSGVLKRDFENIRQGQLKNESTKAELDLKQETITLQEQHLAEEKSYLDLRERNLNQVVTDVQVLKDKINNDRRLNDEQLDLIHKQNAKLRKKESELNLYKEQVEEANKLLKSLYIKADNKARKAKYFFRFVLRLIMVLIGVFLCFLYYYVNKDTITDFSPNLLITLIINVTVFIITVIGYRLFIFKCIDSISEKIYDRVYCKFIDDFKNN